MNKNEKKALLLLDVLEILLSLLAIVIFTILFRFESSNIRYLFLMGVIYVIYSFSKALSSLEGKVEKRVLKNSNSKIDAKYLKKISI